MEGKYDRVNGENGEVDFLRPCAWHGAAGKASREETPVELGPDYASDGGPTLNDLRYDTGKLEYPRNLNSTTELLSASEDQILGDVA